MAGFVSKYEIVVNQCLNLVDGTAVAVNDFIHDVEDLLGWIPFIGGVITDLLNELASLVQDLLDGIMKLIEQAQAPVLFWQFADMWGSGGISDKAGTIASTLAGQKQFTSEWQGLAGAAFAASVSGQEPAVDTVQTRSIQVATACRTIAQFGFVFYLAQAGLLTALIVYALISGAAPGAFIAEVVKVSAAVAAAVAALEFGVSAQANNLQQAAEPSDTMPDGEWPQAVADIRAVPLPNKPKTYTVVAGDSLWEIAGREFGDPNLWPVIQAANSREVPDANFIFAGEVLQIPSIPKVPADSTAYVVRPGDTLSGIADGNPALVQRIAAVNRLHQNRIYAGQVLIIPPGS